VSDTVKAPWTPEQVDALNGWQRITLVHPFTCGGLNDTCRWNLTATPGGWICERCDYTQDWAHSFMTDPAVIARYEDVLRQMYPETK
jgi:hypothetical protein